MREDSIFDYIIENYDITKEKLQQEIKENELVAAELEKGIRLLSYPYFVGDRIAAILNLEYIGEEDEIH